MNDVDHMIARLRGEPLPASLGALDDAVMSGLVAGRERLAGRRALGLACCVAAVVGLWGGLWGGLSGAGPEHGHDDLLLGLPAAAPSHLLAS
jgi:hypothetical protein